MNASFNTIPFCRRAQDFDRVAARTVQQRRVPRAQGQTQVLSAPGMQVINQFNSLTFNVQLIYYQDT